MGGQARLAIALALVVAGCNRTSSDAAENSGLGDGGAVFGGATTDARAAVPECAEDTKDVFVISAQNALYQFHPPTLTFKNLGLLQCATGGAVPTSMAVDRRGIAWVRHSDGSLWKVRTKDLACEPTRFTAPAEGGFAQFGMGFSTQTKGGTNEVLYLSDHEGGGLAKLDAESMVLSFIGEYTGPLKGKTSELTGTGDGKLYGLFVTLPVQIAELSKGTGEILSTKELPAVYSGDAWAFSFYGGDFYVYTHQGSGGLPQNDKGSTVTRYRPSDGSVEVVKTNLGFTIVGAGVSTCAPTATPR